MKLILKIGLLFLLPLFARSQTQQQQLYSLHLALKGAPNDTMKMSAYYNLIRYYSESNRDSTMFFVGKALVIAKKINQPLWTAKLLIPKAYVLMQQGNLPLSFKLTNEAMVIVNDKNSEKNVYIEKGGEFSTNTHKYRLNLLNGVLHQLGNLYVRVGNEAKAIVYYKEEIQNAELLNSKSGLVASNMNIGSIYLRLNKLDSAYFYSRKALANSNLTGLKKYNGVILANIGTVYFKRNQLDSAKQYYWKSLVVHRVQNNRAAEISTHIVLATLYKSIQRTDSMMYYAKEALAIASNLKIANNISTSSELISEAYKMNGSTDSAFYYLVNSKKIRDSLNQDRNEKLVQFQKISFDEQTRLEQVEKENIAFQNKIITTALLTGLGLLSVLAFVFYRNNRQKLKANQILESTLSDLKSTQSQLIQSEKMASLGELTAGIAHEIQNPLNFVNNFSEVSMELIEEVKSEKLKAQSERDEHFETELLNDIAQNLEKIAHHGKRADGIVKGMLQHSRASSTTSKEPTDINKLADEYLRLAYHGLRAKDKTFNAAMDTDYDETIGNINIIPQDIGRVILNLITNAFYAVEERRKAEGEGFKARIEVSTKSITLPGGQRGALISVKDNGNGIPDVIKDKIFQPFFTTKPTGQGTGLGLSLSYDIVKAHGGEVKVNTIENEDLLGEETGTEFTIQLPV